MKTISNNQWLRTDETREAILGLHIVWEMLKCVKDEPYYWKWVVLALHNSLQGFMVLALRGSDGLRTLKDECATAWLKAYESGKDDYPELRLKSFLELYSSIKSDKMRIYEISQLFRPKGTQDQSVKRLNRIRNDFIHYAPKSWSLEINGLYKMVDDCIELIGFLVFDSQNILLHEELMDSEIRELITNIRSFVRL